MALVAPSMLSADFLHLSRDVAMVNTYADIFHLDVMDGTFVPNISFGFPVIDAIASGASKPLDVHLMIVEPWKYIERVAKTGAAMVSSTWKRPGNALKAGTALLTRLRWPVRWE